ncbi:MAG: GTPase ObgE [Cyanobacteria bacterium SIG30]|nr:GTPase ObgE [Cyanobacteria bacterium SIG30]
MASFIDKARIKIISGHGGNGMVAWRREKYVDKGGPAGGDGGKGGDVYLLGDSCMSTLMDFKHKSVFKAEAGENGRGKNQHGACANDLIIKVPVGVIVTDISTGKIVADIKENGQKVLLAKGGRGGRGNARFATAQKRAPQFCEPGEPSIERELSLELKLIADVGLLGFPNVGKSTLISIISSAKPKIADYPFTTLVPNLGVVEKPNGETFVVADIPGLIENASDGVGLGYEFLRHVQRCKFLVHLVDISAENPIENYRKINFELEKFDKELAKRYQIIVLNKTDIVDDKTKEKIFKEFEKISNDVCIISCATKDGFEKLLNRLYNLTETIEAPVIEVEIDEDNDATNNDDSEFEITKLDKNTYYVDGGKIRRLASVTDERNLQQIRRFSNILDSMGVWGKLKEMGAKQEDIIIAGGIEVVYLEKYF